MTHAGNLVGHEFGVARAFERRDPRQDRNLVVPDALDERAELGHVEDKLRDREFRRPASTL
jgi:hypothetical protein